METWRLAHYSFSTTLAPGLRLPAEINRLLSLTLPLRWQESWLVTTLGITAASQDWLPLAVLKMITADLRMLKVLFHAQSQVCSSLQGHRHMSLLVYLSASIQSLLPNELYKFNHVEGCLVCHQVLIRVWEGWGLISSLSATSLTHEGMKL